MEKFSLWWKRASPTQAPFSNWNRQQGYAGLAWKWVPWIGEDEGILGSCSSWWFWSSLTTASMQAVVLVGYITNLIKWLSWMKSARALSVGEVGNWMGKKRKQFSCQISHNFFLKMEFFSVLTFMSFSKIIKNYLAHSFVALYGLLQRARPWPAMVGVDFHACQTWRYQDLFVLSIWWLFAVVGFCQELKYSPLGQVSMS